MIDIPPRGFITPPIHILVMDDAPALLAVLQELLEDSGYRVTASLERLDLPEINALHPDVILLDLLFADAPEAGTQFLDAVRHGEGLSGIPIILCTGASTVVQKEVMAEQLRRLHVHVVLKPFDIDDLLAVVAEALTAAQRGSVLQVPTGTAH